MAIDGFGTILKFDKFLGINNIANPSRIPAGYLAEATDINIDIIGGIEQRDGYTLKTAGNFKSLWADGNDCFVVDKTMATLKRINPIDLSMTDIKTGIYEDVSYTRFNDIIIVTDGVIIGYIAQDGWHDLPAAVGYRHINTPAGQIVRIFQNRLFVIRGNVIYYTEAGDIGSMDEEKGFLNLPAVVTLCESVLDGIFIAADKTYFMTQDFQLIEKAPYGAIAGTAAYPDISFVGALRDNSKYLSGRVVYWMSEKGICRGWTGGQFENLTIDKYNLPVGIYTGSGLFRVDGINRQCIFTVN